MTGGVPKSGDIVSDAGGSSFKARNIPSLNLARAHRALIAHRLSSVSRYQNRVSVFVLNNKSLM
jgi:hypothetical protein